MIFKNLEKIVFEEEGIYMLLIYIIIILHSHVRTYVCMTHVPCALVTCHM